MVKYENCDVILNNFKNYINIHININSCNIYILLNNSLKKDFYDFANDLINTKPCSFLKIIDSVCYLKMEVYDDENLLNVFTEFINISFEINDQIINIFKDITKYYEINNIV